MKSKLLAIITVTFFLLVHTMVLWEGYLGASAIPVFLLFALMYLILAILLAREILRAINLKFASKQQNITIFLLLAVLGLTAWRPAGIINFNSLEAKAVLIAEHEGAANCTVMFRLNENGRFRHRSVCFGIEETTGNYRLSNDTVYFSDTRGWPYSYGIIKRNDSSLSTAGHRILLYGPLDDKKPVAIPVNLLKIP